MELFGIRRLSARFLAAISAGLLSACSMSLVPETECGSEESLQSLQTYMAQAALRQEGSSEKTERLLEILRSSAAQSGEEIGSQFEEAITAIDNLMAEAESEGQTVALNPSEFVERGVSEAGAKLCWVTLDVGITEAAQEEWDLLSENLSVTNRGTSVPSLPEIEELEIFYSLAREDTLSVTDTDISLATLRRLKDIILLSESASLAQPALSAQRAAVEERQRAANAAREAQNRSALARARAALASSRTALNDLWASFDPKIQSQLNAAQLRWIDQRNARCSPSAKQARADPSQRELNNALCLTAENEARVRELGGIGGKLR
jgi:uncharacterized protein YecT (DUF1311 family)